RRPVSLAVAVGAGEPAPEGPGPRAIQPARPHDRRQQPGSEGAMRFTGERVPTLAEAHEVVSRGRFYCQHVAPRQIALGLVAWLESQRVPVLWCPHDGQVRIFSIGLRPDPAAVEVARFNAEMITRTMLATPGCRASGFHRQRVE